MDQNLRLQGGKTSPNYHDEMKTEGFLQLVVVVVVVVGAFVVAVIVVGT